MMHKCKTEWADCVWNPVTGCLYDCAYCIAREQSKHQCGDSRLHMTTAKRWKDTDIFYLDKPFAARNNRFLAYPYGYAPTFHEYRMGNLAVRKVGAKILVCSMGELFGDWVPDELISMVFAECEKYPQHTYFFLTKNPLRYLHLAETGKLPKRENMWYGTSVPTDATEYFFGEGYNVFLDIEPMLTDFSGGKDIWANWVIVGAESKARKAPVAPQREWVEHVAQACEKQNIPIFMRNNLSELMGPDFMQVYPDILTVQPELTVKQKRIRLDVCGSCKQEMPKKEMNTLTVRKGKNGPNKVFCFLCDKCLDELRKKME